MNMHPEKFWDQSRFDEMSWHDNRVYGLRIRNGMKDGEEPELWGELELDIDFILEWLRPTESTFAFRLAPATLTFVEVFDLRIEIDYAAPGASVTPFSISEIKREAIEGSGLANWRIELNWPKGTISFAAAGFRQVLRSKPIVSSSQSLGHQQRSALSG